MDNRAAIEKFVKGFREKIEPHWSEDLLYEKFVHRLNEPVSAGYCGPSSVLLFKELLSTFPNEKFSVAVGRVYSDSKEWIIGKHVWVIWHQKLKAATIIDITADQSEKIKDKIIVKDLEELAREGINYLAYNVSHSLDEVDESPKQRALILESRI
jgi:hypothetical protein